MGSLRFVPAVERGPEGHWILLAWWPNLLLLPADLPDGVVEQVWSVFRDAEASIESVVSSIPLRGEGQVESFAFVRLVRTSDQVTGLAEWMATVVVRGRAAVDLLSEGGSRRFGSRGAQPWALAEFGSVIGVTVGEMPPMPESMLRLPADARRLDQGIAKASRVLWAASAEQFITARDDADHADGADDAADADDETVVRPRTSEPPEARHEPSEELRTVAEAPRYVFRVGDGPDRVLTGPVVIGRRPQPRRTYSTEAPALVTVDSPEGKVSQNHVEIAPVGRTVVITDLRSTNGCVVTLEGAAARRLRQGDSVVATGSAIVEIGDGNVIHISSRDRENTETTA